MIAADEVAPTLKAAPNTYWADIVAGLSVASILLPEAVAYSSIANLSVQHAITALLVGLVGYAVVGASRFAIVAPTSSSAALTAAAVISLGSVSAGVDPAGFAFALVLLTGAGLLLIGLVKLGRLSAFVSRPVLHGFSFALAVTIIIKQLPIVLGVKAGGDPLHVLLGLWRALPHWSLPSALSGLLALTALLSLKRWSRLPGAFLVLATAVGVAYWVPLTDYGIATVGAISLTVPMPALPVLTLDQWLRTAELAGGLMVIIFAESWGSVRSLALRHGDSLASNRELLALGATNLASGVFQGMAVGAGFSASSANEAAGAQSKLAGLVAAGAVLMLAIFGTRLIELIPEPVLAAAVISALLHALNPKPLLALWRLDRDQYLALLAVLAVLFFGVLHGMLIAVALSIASAIRTFSQPVVKELGELGDTRNYVDRGNHTDTVVHPGVLVLRPEEPLFFASVEGVLADIKARIANRTDVKNLVLSLEESPDIDSTAAECMVDLLTILEHHQINFVIARAKDPVRAVLLKIAPDKFNDKFFWSVADAVASVTGPA